MNFINAIINSPYKTGMWSKRPFTKQSIVYADPSITYFTLFSSVKLLLYNWKCCNRRNRMSGLERIKIMNTINDERANQSGTCRRHNFSILTAYRTLRRLTRLRRSYSQASRKQTWVRTVPNRVCSSQSPMLLSAMRTFIIRWSLWLLHSFSSGYKMTKIHENQSKRQTSAPIHLVVDNLHRWPLQRIQNFCETNQV